MITTAIVTAFAKFVAALGACIMAYRNWRQESDKEKAKKEKENKEES